MKNYYYINAAGNQVGPLQFEQLPFGEITPDTLVWCDSMSEWDKASNVPEIADRVMPTTPPPINPQISPEEHKSSTSSNYHYYQAPPTKPQSYLWLGIITTLVFCLPCGIVSIIYASKVDDAWLRGEYQLAEDYSRKARNWGLIPLYICAALFVLTFIVSTIISFATIPDIKY